MSTKRIAIIRSAVASLSSVGLIDFFRENDIEVIGTDITDQAVGKYVVDKFYLVPPALEREKMFRRYVDIVRKHHVRTILSGPEEEIFALSTYQDEFQKAGAFVLHPPAESLEIIGDKWRAYQILSPLGINMPHTRVLENVKRLKPGKQFIIKPKKGRGSRDVFRVDHKSFARQSDQLLAGKFLVQDFMDGCEVSVDVLYNRQGRLLNMVARKRLKTDSGICIIGQTTPAKPFVQVIEKLSDRVKMIGGACFQFIEQGGQYYLTDINPRLGGGVNLSLQASPLFRKNLLALLRGNPPVMAADYGKYKTMSMFRYYNEIYRP